MLQRTLFNRSLRLTQNNQWIRTFARKTSGTKSAAAKGGVSKGKTGNGGLPTVAPTLTDGRFGGIGGRYANVLYTVAAEEESLLAVESDLSVNIY